MAETIYKAASTNSNMPVVVYSDLNGLFYESSPEMIVYNLGAIANHIMNIFLTRKGECDFEPTFGSRLPEIMYSPFNDLQRWKLTGFVYRDLKTWEPDVTVNQKATTINSFPDTGNVQIGVAVTVASINVSNVQITIEEEL